ncbi:MAG TPA: AAA family ATPase, partial [Polyangiaceae bacterium]
MIHNVLGGVCVLYGPPGCFKTFIAIGMGVAVASGKPWLGNTTQQGPVLYCLGEGGRAMFNRRATTAAMREKVDPTTLQLWMTDHMVDMSSPEKLDAWWPEWDLIAPRLVVIDTLSRCMPGDENTQEAMQGFVASADAVRKRYDSAVLILHHENKAAGMRGSTVLPGAVDVTLHIERRQSAGIHVKMKAEKLRDLDAEEFPTQELTGVVYPVVDANGVACVDEFGDTVKTVVFQDDQIEAMTA